MARAWGTPVGTPSTHLSAPPLFLRALRLRRMGGAEEGLGWAGGDCSWNRSGRLGLRREVVLRAAGGSVTEMRLRGDRQGHGD